MLMCFVATLLFPYPHSTPFYRCYRSTKVRQYDELRTREEGRLSYFNTIRGIFRNFNLIFPLLLPKVLFCLLLYAGFIAMQKNVHQGTAKHKAQ